MKQMKNIVFTLALLLSSMVLSVVEEVVDVARPVKTPEATKLDSGVPAKKDDEKKQEVKVKQIETKEIAVAPAPIKSSSSKTFFEKAKKIQDDVQKFIGEAAEYVESYPADKEKVLEQIGAILGMSIAGLEAVSGEKILDFEAMEAAEKEAQKKAEKFAEPTKTETPKKVDTSKTSAKAEEKKTAEVKAK